MKKKLIFAAALFCLFLLAIFSLKAAQVYKQYKFRQDLTKAVKEESVSLKADYSFFVKDLSFWARELKFKEGEHFPAASLIKLPILASALKAVEEKKISLGDTVYIRRKDIAGGSGKLKAYALPYKLSVEKLLELMIAVSDNTAANKVIKMLGYDYINKSFEELGLKDTSLVREMMDFSSRRKGIENYTSARDIAFVLEKIYSRALINKKLSLLALSFLKKQKVNDRLPRYLPEKAQVAHKTGLERGVVHDAGLVFGPPNYVICVLTKNAASRIKAKKFIAKLSLKAYNLFNKY